jgi:hypothetical protein
MKIASGAKEMRSDDYSAVFSFRTAKAVKERTDQSFDKQLSMSFEILNSTLVLPRRSACFESTQVPALAGLRVLLPRVKTVLSRC